MGIWIRTPGAQGRGCVFRFIDLEELALSMNERELAESRLLRDEREAKWGGVGGMQRCFKEESLVSCVKD